MKEKAMTVKNEDGSTETLTMWEAESEKSAWVKIKPRLIAIYKILTNSF